MIIGIVLAKYEVELSFRGESRLPLYKGSTLRGALTIQFKRLVCHQPHTKSCQGCELEQACPYSYIFETPAPPGQKGTVGFSTFPRPFVVEPPLDNRNEYSDGDVLEMGLILFGKAIEYIPYFIVTLRELASTGIGTYRTPFELGRIYSVDDLTGRRELLYDPATGTVRDATIRLGCGDAVRYASQRVNAEDLTIRFLTCTKLMHGGHPTFRPEFHVLVRNLLRRISSLSTGHCGGWPDLDYTGLISRAGGIRIVGCRVERVSWEHVSSRQRRRVPHEGIVGEVTYRGDVEEFLPLLAIGTFTHVGDSCVFGMGRYVIV